MGVSNCWACSQFSVWLCCWYPTASPYSSFKGIWIRVPQFWKLELCSVLHPQTRSRNSPPPRSGKNSGGHRWSLCHYAANSRKVSHWDVNRFFLRFHGGNCCRPRIRCHNGGRWNVERSATSGLKGWKTLKHFVFVTFLGSFWANMRETSWENFAGVVLVSQLLQGIPFHSTVLARHIVKPLSKWLTSKLSCWLFQSIYKYRDMGIC